MSARASVVMDGATGLVTVVVTEFGAEVLRTRPMFSVTQALRQASLELGYPLVLDVLKLADGPSDPRPRPGVLVRTVG